MSVKVHEAYSLDSSQDRLLWWDDFLGDQLKDEWVSAGNAGGSAVVVDAQTGGIVRITSNNVLNETWRIDWGSIRSLLVTKKATMEVRAKTTQATFTAITLDLRFDGNNYISFAFNEAAGGAINWGIQCRDGGAGALFDSGIAVDTSEHIFRMECHTHGGNHVHFYIDGVETANSPITTNIPDDAGDYLMPRLNIRAREDAAKSMDIDYVAVRQEI